jgi:hypothetical protein
MEDLSNRGGPLPVREYRWFLDEVPRVITAKVDDTECLHPWLEDPTDWGVLEEVESPYRGLGVNVRRGRWAGPSRRTVPYVDDEFRLLAGAHR